MAGYETIAAALAAREMTLSNAAAILNAAEDAYNEAPLENVASLTTPLDNAEAAYAKALRNVKYLEWYLLT